MINFYRESRIALRVHQPRLRKRRQSDIGNAVGWRNPPLSARNFGGRQEGIRWVSLSELEASLVSQSLTHIESFLERLRTG